MFHGALISSDKLDVGPPGAAEQLFDTPHPQIRASRPCLV